MAQGKLNFTVGFNVDQAGLNQLKNSLNNIMNMSPKDIVGAKNITEATQKLKEAQSAAKILQNALKDSFNPTLNTYNIDLFKKKIANSSQSISNLRKQLIDSGAQGTIVFRQLSSAITSTHLPLKESHNLLKSMGTTLMNTIKWSIASNAINTVTGSVQKAWSYTKQLDESLNDIMLVTDKSAESMERFAKQANRAAKELGKSTKDYTQASLIYYQQGLSDEEVRARTETTLKAANVTGQSAQAVSEQLTAVWNGYRVQTEQTEQYIDKLAKVAATTAADLEELSTGMSKVASAANNMGVDVDQLNAMLATTISVTRQAPESVGTAFKTIFARISDIEAGLDGETSLGEYTKQMAQMGINVLDSQGKLRDMGSVIEEIGSKWATLTDEQQISLAQTMAGTRQYNNLLALFENWDMYTKSVKDSAQATGFLQKQQDEYMESVEAHLKELSTAGERVYDALFNAESINDLLDVLTVATELFGNFVESIGGGGNLLMALVPVLTRLFSGTLANGISTFITNLKSSRTEAELLKNTLDTLNGKDGIIDNDKLKETDKWVLQIRKHLAELAQQKIITNEEYNGYIDQLKEFEKQTSEIELSEEASVKTAQRMTDLRSIFGQQSGAGSSVDFKLQYANAQKRGEQFYAESGGATQSKELIEDSGSYKAVQRGLNLITEGSEQATASIGELIEEIKELLTNGGSLSDIGEKWAAIVQEGDKFKKLGGGVAIDIGNVQAQVSKSISSMSKKTLQEQGEAVKSLESHLDAYYNSIEDGNRVLHREIQNANKQYIAEASGAFSKLKSKQESLSIELKNALEPKLLEKSVNHFIQMASNAGLLLSALQTITNLPSIWKNEDLSVGEKILQTSQNLISTVGMLSPLLMGVVGWYKKINTEIMAQNLNTLSSSALDTLKKEINEKITDEKEKQLLLSLAEKGELTAENVELLKKYGITKSITKEEMKQAALKKVKTGFSDFGKGFSAGWKNGGFKGAAGAGKAAGSGSAIGSIGGVLGAAAPILAVAFSTVAAADLTSWLIGNAENEQKEAFENAKLGAESLTQELEKTQSKVNELESSISSLEDAESAFDGLTKGTLEWEKALNKVNSQVLSLLKEYPELMEYTSTDEHGVMSIADEGLIKIQREQFEELKKAQAASEAADIEAQKAKIKMLQDENAELAVGSGSQSTTAGVTAGAGAVIGGLIGIIGGPWGVVIGSAIGAALGGSIAAGNYAIQENKEDQFESYLESDAFNNVVKAYESSGDVIFESTETLAKALGKDVTALTNNEKALIENKNKATELAHEIAINTATLQANRAQIGVAFVGEDATSGEKAAAGAAYEKEYANQLQKLRDNAGFNGQDEEDALRALSIMGLDASDFIGTEGSNRVQYTDKDGNKQDVHIEKLWAIIAKYEAERAVKVTAEEISKQFKGVLDGYTNTQKEILSKLGQSDFNFNNASYEDFQALVQRGLTSEQAKAFAEANGITIEAVQYAWDETVSSALNQWRAPAGLTDQAKEYFDKVISNIDISDATLIGYNKFADSFSKIYDEFGESGANVLYTVLKSAGDKAGNLLNEIASFDWTSDAVRENFGQILSNLDINLDSGILSEFLKSMRRINGLYGDTSEALSKLNKSILEITKDLTIGDTLSPEEYKELQKKLPLENLKEFFVELEDGTYQLIKSGNELNQLRHQYINQESSNSIEEKIVRLGELNDLNSTIEAGRASVENYSLPAKTVAEYQKEAYDAVEKLWNQGNIQGVKTVDKATLSSIYGEGAQSRQQIISTGLLTANEIDNLINNGSQEAQTKLIKAFEASALLTYGTVRKYDGQGRLLPGVAIDNEGYDYQILKNQEDDYNNAWAEFNKKYGELNSSELIQVEIEKIQNEVKQEFESRLTRSQSFEELAKIKNEASKYGIDTLENYEKEVQRVGLSIFTAIQDQAQIPASALDEYVENFKGENKDLIEAYNAAFAELLKSSASIDTEIKNINKDFEDLNDNLDNLDDANAVSNLKQQLELIDQLLGENGKFANKLDFISNKARTNIGVQFEALVNELTNSGYSLTDLNINNFIGENGELNEEAVNQFRELYLSNSAAWMNSPETKELFDNIFESLDNYGTEYEDIQEEIKQIEQDRLDKNFELLERNLKLSVKGFEIQKVINDYQKEFLEEDDFSSKTSYIVSDMSETISIVNANKIALKELEAAYAENKISEANYNAQRQELLNAQLDGIKELKDLNKELNDTQIEAVENLSKLYEKQADARENLISLAEKEIELNKLLYGEDAYNQFDYGSVVAQKKNLVTDKQAEADYWEGLMNSPEFSSFSQEYQDAIIKNFQSASQDLVNATFDLIETREAEFLNAQEKIMSDFTNKFMPNGRTLAGLEEEWAWMKEDDEKYLDGIEQGFAFGDLNRKFDDATRNTTNASALAKLNKVRQEELDILKSKDKLTETDFKRAEARLKITEAEIALQEAQQNKTKMQLTRGADGTYSYQYVADTEAIAEKEKELAEANQELYQLDKEAYQQNLDEFYSLYTQWQDRMREAYADGIVTPEEAEMLNKYQERLETLAEENAVFQSNLIKTTDELLGQFGKDADSIITTTSTGLQELITGVKNSSTEFGQLYTDLNGLSSTYRETVETDAAIITEANEKVEASYTSIIDGLKGEDGGLINAQNEVKENNQMLADSVGVLKTKYEELGTSIDILIEKYKRLTSAKSNAENTESDSGNGNGGGAPSLSYVGNGTQAGILKPEGGGTGVGDEIPQPEPQMDVSGYSVLKSGEGWSVKGLNNAVLADYDEFEVKIGNDSYSGLQVFHYDRDDNPDSGVWAIGETESKLNYVSGGTPSEGSIGAVGEGDGAVAYLYRHGHWRKIFYGSSSKADAGVANSVHRAAQAATGGYTGEWGPEGKWAILHQKELILNAAQTVDIMKGLSNLNSLKNAINAQIGLLQEYFGNQYHKFETIQEMAKEFIVQQKVDIHAEFPNATDSAEIQEAFRQLSNLATQHAFENNR